MLYDEGRTVQTKEQEENSLVDGQMWLLPGGERYDFQKSTWEMPLSR